MKAREQSSSKCGRKSMTRNMSHIARKLEVSVASSLRFPVWRIFRSHDKRLEEWIREAKGLLLFRGVQAKRHPVTTGHFFSVRAMDIVARFPVNTLAENLECRDGVLAIRFGRRCYERGDSVLTAYSSLTNGVWFHELGTCTIGSVG